MLTIRIGVVYTEFKPVAYFVDEVTRCTERLTYNDGEFISYYTFYDQENLKQFLFELQTKLLLKELEV